MILEGFCPPKEGKNRAETKPWLLWALTELHLQEQGVNVPVQALGRGQCPGGVQCSPESLIPLGVTWVTPRGDTGQDQGVPHPSTAMGECPAPIPGRAAWRSGGGKEQKPVLTLRVCFISNNWVRDQPKVQL